MVVATVGLVTAAPSARQVLNVLHASQGSMRRRIDRASVECSIRSPKTLLSYHRAFIQRSGHTLPELCER